jgi:hypothetical protein
MPEGPPDNFCLITLDSCRYDTARAARPPALGRMAPLHRAWAQGTYTWPSHLSMFVGLLPNVHPGARVPLLNRFFRQLVRLEHGPTKGRSAVLSLEGVTLPEGFRRRGYSVLGSGAVGWFGGTHEAFWSSMFGGNFRFTGCDLRQQIAFTLASPALRAPYFLFMNVGETHLPYEYGDRRYPAPWEEFEGFGTKWEGAPRWSGEFPAVSDRSWRVLRKRQREALQWVDRQLEELWRALPRPVQVVVVADHGDCLGEDGLLGHGFYHPKVLEVPMYVFRLT